MRQLYDTLIIGAGIAGVSSAYILAQKGHRVLVLDKKGIASGGSGAAGAFVSPKIGKGSALQQLTNEAFTFAKDFYLEYFPKFYHQSGVVRIPKDESDARKFPEYEKYNVSSYTKWDSETLKAHYIHVPLESFFFDEAGACDAPDLCRALLEGIEYVQYEAEALHREEGVWTVGKYRAKNVVLATGYENRLFDMRYMDVKGTWGTRGDFRSLLPLDVSMHRSMSVSANINGIVRLGATHEKEVSEPMPCRDEQALGLKEKASRMVDTSEMELVETFCGMRAGSKDYFPLVGRVVDVPFMLENYPAVTRGEKPPFHYIEHLYVCNGLGGRGFVLGPMMGKMLSELIVNGKEVDERVDPNRLFLKWCRKSPELDSLR